MAEPIWFDKPSVLFEKDNLRKFVWLPGMTYNEKQNAAARFFLYFSLLGYLYFNRREFLYFFVLVLAILFYGHYKQPEMMHRLLNVKYSDKLSEDWDDYMQAGGGQSFPHLGALPISGELLDGGTSGGCSIEQTGGSSMNVGNDVRCGTDVYYGGSEADWKATYGKASRSPKESDDSLEADRDGGAFEGYSNDLVDPKVRVDPKTNQICKVSTPDNPFGNTLPGDNEVLNATPICDPSAHKQTIEANFDKGLFNNLDDIFQRNNSQRQFVVNPSTTVPNDRESFMTWLWETPFVCRDGDMDACFKQGY